VATYCEKREQFVDQLPSSDPLRVDIVLDIELHVGSEAGLASALSSRVSA